jgi:hypothetical protein
MTNALLTVPVRAIMIASHGNPRSPLPVHGTNRLTLGVSRRDSMRRTMSIRLVVKLITGKADIQPTARSKPSTLQQCRIANQ